MTSKEKTKQDIFTTFISNNEYQADPEEDEYSILTTVRYTNNKVTEAFVCDYEGEHIFKISISEANVSDLPEQEVKAHKSYLEYLKEIKENV